MIGCLSIIPKVVRGILSCQILSRLKLVFTIEQHWCSWSFYYDIPINRLGRRQKKFFLQLVHVKLSLINTPFESLSLVTKYLRIVRVHFVKAWDYDIMNCLLDPLPDLLCTSKIDVLIRKSVYTDYCPQNTISRLFNQFHSCKGFVGLLLFICETKLKALFFDEPIVWAFDTILIISFLCACILFYTDIGTA